MPWQASNVEIKRVWHCPEASSIEGQRIPKQTVRQSIHNKGNLGDVRNGRKDQLKKRKLWWTEDRAVLRTFTSHMVPNVETTYIHVSSSMQQTWTTLHHDGRLLAESKAS
jgi:hypothetical protein